MLAGAVLEHRHDGAHGLLPDLALVLHVDAERLELGDRRALAHAELEAAVRQQVEAGELLGDARGMVGGELHDAVAEPDVLGALAGGGEEQLRRRRVGVFLEEVVLDLPGVVVAEPVGELDLRRARSGRAGARRPLPGARQLQLVEDAELHARSPPGLATILHRVHGKAMLCSPVAGTPVLISEPTGRASRSRAAPRERRSGRGGAPRLP